MSPGHSLYRGFVDKCEKIKKLGQNFTKECSKSSKNITNQKSVKFCIDLATRKKKQFYFSIEKSKVEILMIEFRSDFNEKSHFNGRESSSVESRFVIKNRENIVFDLSNHFFSMKNKSWNFFRVAKLM